MLIVKETKEELWIIYDEKGAVQDEQKEEHTWLTLAQ